MSAMPERDPARDLADGFAAQVARWAKAHEDVARAVARELSLATSRGHVCITLEELVAADAQLAPSQALRECLLASGVAGTSQAPRAFPIVVDDDGRVYLHRYFDYERRLARRLAAAARMPAREPGSAARELLGTLFAASSATSETDWQKIAAALALRNGLVVISGGPGTGKTTTVVNLLACLLAQDPHSRIALAAPTGKAAARMTEAIRLRSDHLPAALRQRLPEEAFTIHRLLRFHPRHGFGHDANDPLPIDVLVVDEASMLDLALVTRLLEAVPPRARVVLLGDKDQLSAVESGAVFAELCADPMLDAACRAQLEKLCKLRAGSIVTPEPEQERALGNAVVWLQRNYRFAADSGIGRLAAEINAGHADAAVGWLRGEGKSQRVLWEESSSGSLADGYAGYFAAVLRDCRDVAAVHAAFARYRVLCAVREGGEGVTAVNASLETQARDALAEAPGAFAATEGSGWYTGRPVIVTVNDYALKLFNGDVGIALPDEAGQAAVWFPDGASGWRAVAPARMPRHETAFAMTVHKSQGSEFEEVLVMLPTYRSAALTRELLYTAVTRARERVTVRATEDALRTAIAQKVVRSSGLPTRLSEALGASGNGPGRRAGAQR
ncbi:MAG TPA: exodeoxyribonuclease V subunit alpha [Ramlibacter sp.]|uniref:exodeoxyribonuclease V subunit alpha n=1 Tax=Ramlibacter sp. TaxID=1917967 RepID=UPI002BE3E38B|nr:exodeoxyribonuclease V subunit alpha [Ramlibacter sp.]HVZ46875.1 exodeoxyribonuclease V subunit alpha [Ramlibacter sp.]